MTILTNRGEDLDELSDSSKILLIFLRQFGCTFCRETMTDLARERSRIEADGFKIVCVHMVSESVADQILNLYGLSGISHVSDPGQEVYRHFGLGKTRWRSLLAPKVLWRTVAAGVLKGHLAGKPLGDPYQMPGVFVYYKRQILNKVTHRFGSDRPEYYKLVSRAV